MSAPTLHPYQAEVIERLKQAIAAGHRRLCVVAPTGSGKTVIAAEMIRGATARGQRVIFMGHRRELTEQTSQKLDAVEVDHGIVQAGFPARPSAKVQVCSIQTLHARAIRSGSIHLPPADLLFIDECHHARARMYETIIAAYPGAIIIGLTATPCRADGRGLGNTFHALIECPSVTKLTEDKYLVPARVYAPTQPDLRGIKVKLGDFVESQLAARINTVHLIGDIVEHWHRLAKGRRTIAFTVNVAHSVHVRDEFRRSGVLAEHIDGTTPLEERRRILADFAGGKVDVICNCSVLTEGWDRPEASCLILARPTKSLGLFRQMVGRVLRVHPESCKADALIFDHAGAVFEHGLPDDEIVWELHEDRRAQNSTHSVRGMGGRAPALVTCPECSAVRFEGRPCTACGWHPVRKPRPIDVAEGELGEVGRDHSVRANIYQPDEKRRFHRQLLWIAREWGRRSGWAAHAYKAKFGSWPDVPPWAPPEPEPPDAAVRAWVRSRDIAFAKAMAAKRRSAS